MACGIVLFEIEGLSFNVVVCVCVCVPSVLFPGSYLDTVWYGCNRAALAAIVCC